MNFFQILESGFVQREKLAVQQNLESAEARHKDEQSKLEKRLRDKLKAQPESSREKIKADHERKLSEAKKKFLREMEEIEAKQSKLSTSHLEELRNKLAAEKEFELKQQAERLNAKARREMETLRQRFNLIQKSGALERSPSASESELSLEVIKSFFTIWSRKLEVFGFRSLWQNKVM